MKHKICKLLNSAEVIIILGLVIIPIISFLFITISPESPSYTSISRIAWIQGRWLSTFIWAAVVMSAVWWITYCMINNGPLSTKSKRILLIYQTINIASVFIGCILFPAKADLQTIGFINYLHDLLTVSAWALYGIGLIAYSILLGRKNEFLGFISGALLTFVIWTSLFFIRQVVDPTSYVGASAVSEVYTINSFLIYLVVIYLMQRYEVRGE